MPNRTANYVAFYVNTPFSETNLGANTAHDFCYYRQLCAWKGQDSSFPFVDAHAKTYNVRDNSAWETLRSRLHERLNMSKNIVLFLSSNTKNSRALQEEINYGINVEGLPVIVVYPDYKEKTDIADAYGIKYPIRQLWNRLPVFKDSMGNVPTLHIPYRKEFVAEALKDNDLKVQTKASADIYVL